MPTFAIRLYGDPTLRRRSSAANVFDAALGHLGDELVAAMMAAEGAGLAAPQVGVPLRMFALAGTYAGTLDPDDEHDPEVERAAARVYVNPRIVTREGERVDVEGCLSIPGIYSDVRRAACLRLAYQDLAGQWHEERADANHAKAIQHEVDHLDGVLFLDRLAATERRELMEHHREELAQMQRDAKAHLKTLAAQRLPSRPWP